MRGSTLVYPKKFIGQAVRRTLAPGLATEPRISLDSTSIDPLLAHSAVEQLQQTRVIRILNASPFGLFNCPIRGPCQPQNSGRHTLLLPFHAALFSLFLHFAVSAFLHATTMGYLVRKKRNR